MGLFHWHPKNIDQYFLNKQCGFTGRRPFKLNSLIWTIAGLFAFSMGAVLYFGESPDQQRAAQAFKSEKNSTATLLANSGNSPTHGETPPDPSQKPDFSFRGIFQSVAGPGGSSGRAASSSRSHAANQVIRRGENGNDPLTRLPIGTTISARLINSIISTNAASPVIAEIPQEILVHDTSSIPEGAKAIGQATFDDSTRRIQIRFNTLVYPDGDSHSVQAMAMMPDGSAGLEGDYHSETGKRELGNFLGNFIAGFANGMEDRTAGTGLGLPYEVGSLRNGVLNGASQSAQNEAKTFSDDLAKSKAYMTLSGGKSFVIYLDHEYQP
jgi:Bacterial conjugation TrbI-like protein